MIPGQIAEFQIEVFNLQTQVDHFQIKLEGLREDWYTILPSANQSGDWFYFMDRNRESQTIIIHFHPPRHSTTKAGPHPFKLNIYSRNQAAVVTSKAAELLIAEFFEFAAELRPKQMEGWRKTARLKIENRGNTKDIYSIRPRDKAKALKFDVTPRQARIKPGENQVVNIQVWRDVKWYRKFLDNPWRYDFEIFVRSSEADSQPRRDTAIITGGPLLPPWLLMLLVPLAVFLCAALTFTAVDIRRGAIAAATNQQATSDLFGTLAVDETKAAQATERGQETLIAAAATNQQATSDWLGTLAVDETEAAQATESGKETLAAGTQLAQQTQRAMTESAELSRAEALQTQQASTQAAQLTATRQALENQTATSIALATQQAATDSALATAVAQTQAAQQTATQQALENQQATSFVLTTQQAATRAAQQTAVVQTQTADRDGDGVYDINDACPTQGDAGYGVDSRGCPNPPTDSDGDGVFDNDDACRNQGNAGYGVDSRGCPNPPTDSDGDGVFDNDDACRNQGNAGYGVDSRGCPNPPTDSDGDGVFDNDDACRNQGNAGYGVDSRGCPNPPTDSDGDGVFDNDDACPNEGTSQYVFVNAQGCPVNSIGYPAARGNDITNGESLLIGYRITSPDGVYTFQFQPDANVVLYRRGTAIWSSCTRDTPGFAVMQGDGNFVIRNSGGRAIWSSRTQGNSNSRLVVKNSGRAEIINSSGDVVWFTSPETNCE